MSADPSRGSRVSPAMRKASIAAVLGVVVCAGVATADRAMAPIPERARPQVPQPPPPPPPPPVSVGDIRAAAQPALGNWTCKGVELVGDGSSRPLEATLNVALDLDDTWIRARLVAKGTHAMKVDAYRTFDVVAKEWTEVSMANNGAHHVATSTGEANGTWTWVGAESSQSGTVQRRDYETIGATVKLWGERLLGGEWQKSYEMTCAR
jgi:hypothetical protein